MSQAPNILHKVPRPVVCGELQTCVDYNVTPEQIQRRERMIDFLENECPVEAFTFNRVKLTDPKHIQWECEERGVELKPYCGTIGCAMGHAERLFDLYVHGGNFDRVASDIFGLTEFEARDAFSPSCPRYGKLPPADWDATPQQVATRLREAFRRHPSA